MYIEIPFFSVIGMYKEQVRPGWGVAILESVLALTVFNIAALFHVYKRLNQKLEEFIEAVQSIDLSRSVEMSADAMEVQMQAAKQAQIFDFLRSVVQPNISVSEVTPRGIDGKFA